MPGVDASDRVLRRRVPEALTGAHGTRTGEQFDETRRHRDRAGSRSAAAVGGGEGLVQVEVDDVEAHVARADNAEDRVQVGAVVVEEPAGVVDHLGDLDDVFFEQAEGVRVREHDSRDVGTELFSQLVTIDETARDRRRPSTPRTHRASPTPDLCRARSPG